MQPNNGYICICLSLCGCVCVCGPGVLLKFVFVISGLSSLLIQFTQHIEYNCHRSSSAVSRKSEIVCYSTRPLRLMRVTDRCCLVVKTFGRPAQRLSMT